MTLTWHKVTDRLPDPADPESGAHTLCVLYGESGAMFGPIAWSATHQMWLDLFGPLATKEAGTGVRPDQPGLTHWAYINIPEEDGNG